MKKEKTLFGILCGFGGALIGAFANKLDTIYGGVLFTFGVFLLVFSILFYLIPFNHLLKIS